MARDKQGTELKPGDIVTVVVKYKVIAVYDHSILASKVYDVPSDAVILSDRFTKVDEKP